MHRNVLPEMVKKGFMSLKSGIKTPIRTASAAPMTYQRAHSKAIVVHVF